MVSSKESDVHPLPTCEIQELLEFTGSIRLYHNDKHTYIVYEQIIENDDFIPVSKGLYKFHFCSTDLPSKKEIITYGDFIKELQTNHEAGFKIYDDNDATGVTSSYVRKMIEVEHKNIYKYQIRFKL